MSESGGQACLSLRILGNPSPDVEHLPQPLNTILAGQVRAAATASVVARREE
jgi:hypothetical protein